MFCFVSLFHRSPSLPTCGTTLRLCRLVATAEQSNQMSWKDLLVFLSSLEPDLTFTQVLAVPAFIPALAGVSHLTVIASSLYPTSIVTGPQAAAILLAAHLHSAWILFCCDNIEIFPCVFTYFLRFLVVAWSTLGSTKGVHYIISLSSALITIEPTWPRHCVIVYITRCIYLICFKVSYKSFYIVLWQTHFLFKGFQITLEKAGIDLLKYALGSKAIDVQKIRCTIDNITSYALLSQQEDAFNRINLRHWLNFEKYCCHIH